MKTIQDTSNPKRKILTIEHRITSDHPLTEQQVQDEIAKIKKRNFWGKGRNVVHEDLVAYTRCETIVRITKLVDVA